MADAAVTFLLENVTQLLRYYAHLITGAEQELEQLKNDLEFLKAFLRDAAKRPKKEEAFKVIERQIRKAVYEAEDIIDTCLTQAAVAKAKRFSSLRLNPNRLNLAQEVKSLRASKVNQMVVTAQSFAKTEIGQGSNTDGEERRPKVSKLQAIRQENIVGFEDEEKTIISYLLEPKKELDVISIIGMPGLGKTTLAWKIYKSQSIQFEFPNRIWVYVSQTLNSRDVFLNILKEFTSEDMYGLSDHALAETVRLYLETRKFLLVLDDVWTVSAWNEIQFVLAKANSMGKVLITSREKNVGAHACHSRKPHMLRFLSKEESWELLRYEVFGKLDNCPKDLERVGEYIAHQCDGLPLSIVVIGGILVDQFMTTDETSAIKEAWNKVSKNVSTVLKNDKEQRVSDIVALSYDRLADELRDCFLYLGVFPEDYEIPAWTLTRLWIAEGFVQNKDGQSMEETAEENLKDLINRNLVMVDKTNPKGEVKTCRVHDVIHAFCSSKASVKEQNLFQEIKVSNGVFDPPITDIGQYRRLCIHSDLGKFLAERPKATGIRSFLCFNKVPARLPSKYTPTIVDAFELLRVLESKSIKLDQIPRGVTKLFHLRYITLSVDSLDVLPEAISDLWNLQTLVVDTKSDSLRVKTNIWRMIQLRHLKTKAAIILATREEGNAGQNLQTLSKLSPEYCTEDVLNRARNLKRLGIRGKLATLFNTKTLGRLNHLKNLKLVNTFDESASKEPIRFPELTSWFPPYLERLTISATSLDWKHMSTLGKIGTLQVLKLKDNAFTGMSWDVVGEGFQSLHFLLIEKSDLVFWEASADSFPSLTCLVLKNCEGLKEIPKVLVKSLEKLEIEHLGKSAAASARKIEEEKKGDQEQAKASRFGGGFKLSIGPGCE